ncbi:type III secretion system export apparatus subunit SctR [Burkholderia ubonensis]|uniref:type III secretion system export apparatus subunit SctR n=1 Tax=Burkholderia ubonensis TaxID=101571 RepID=UPI00075EFCBD|nr:type III secretion system export apparatus subunit SctR [Burkholderia ubonensis]KVW73117.1 type III secretion system protein SsaR [Burkholderia ubonensis]
MIANQTIDLLSLSIALALLPAAAVLVTSFTKIAIVFALVKNAIGIQQVPSALVTNALALIMTAFVMAPVLHDISENMARGKSIYQDRIEWMVKSATGPVAQFMKKHVDPAEQTRLLDTAKRIWPTAFAERAKPDDFFILVPAFAISEISAAFKIGFLLYLAFVAIDLIVANVLMAMGMIMFSPTIVSIPLKIILFVLADGWSRLVQALILTYQ